jgi:gamma-glutamyltranspeptidase / glutathione hydrolase
MKRIASLILIAVSIIYSCKRNAPITAYEINKNREVDSAAVVSAHPLASYIGVEILKQGGNAADAAIAVHFALAVCYPNAGNIGGGGFFVYRTNEGQVSTLDYREKAPAAAHEKMYLDSLGNVIENLSLEGHLASGVPGSVAGMWEIFNKHSKLKNWSMLIQPAIDLAKKGVVLTEKEAASLNEDAALFHKVNKGITPFNSKSWKQGDVLLQPELATILTLIRDKGRDGFYLGQTADLIVTEMKKGGGIITHDDLKKYNAVWREPISTVYRGHKIFSMPPPSSGGIALAQLLHAVEPFDINAMGHNTTATIHLMVEAERRVYADRASHLGDKDYYPVPQNNLVNKAYMNSRMQTFSTSKAFKSEEIQAGIFKEHEETTHFSVVDKYGNAVASTTTLNGSYGSFVVVKGAGFILNNEMDDFSVKTGHANYYGLVGAEANKIESGKRMLSSMTPTIVEKDGKLKMVVGTPGGSTIITSVFQTIVNVLDHHMTAGNAVTAKRFHHQWKPDTIYVEKATLSDSISQQLKKMGHSIKEREAIGRVEAIVINSSGKLECGADVRGDDDAEGY